MMPGSSVSDFLAVSKSSCSRCAPATSPSRANATPRAKCDSTVDSGPAFASGARMTSPHFANRTRTSTGAAAALSSIGMSLAMATAVAPNSSAIRLASLKRPIIAYDADPNCRLWL